MTVRDALGSLNVGDGCCVAVQACWMDVLKLAAQTKA